MSTLHPITILAPDGVKVILLRRTGKDTVKVRVGYLEADGKLSGWYGAREQTGGYCARPPTHWLALTALPLPSSGGKA